jgi:hypothetical protein
MQLQFQATPTNLMHSHTQHKDSDSNKSQGWWCDAPGLALIRIGVSFLDLNLLGLNLGLWLLVNVV